MSLSKSQSRPSVSRSSDTHLILHLPCLVDTLIDNSRGLHGSLQIRIWLPSPTLQMIPCLRSSSPYMTACQVDEALEQKAVSTRLPLGKYLAFSRRAQRLSGN